MTPEQLANLAMEQPNPFGFLKEWFGEESKEADFIGVARLYGVAMGASQIVKYRMETRIIEEAAKTLATP